MIGYATDDSPGALLGLIAGEGHLPVVVAENAARKGFKVIVFAIARNNLRSLKAVAHQVVAISPGLLDRNIALMRDAGVHQLVFAGKVDKWLLLRNPRLDGRALGLLRQAARLNDDAVMLALIDELVLEGFEVLPQVDFMQDLLLPEGLLSQLAPDSRQWEDVRYGFQMAREMGRLDIGQTIAVKDGMVLAVEAIEGTDECLKRAGRLACRKGGVVVKVAKPEQDLRFDVPTVGLRTLRTMRSAGLKVLAFEADRTLVVDAEAMRQFADRYKMVLLGVSESAFGSDDRANMLLAQS